MRKLIVICSVLLATVGCAQKEATVQSPAAVQAPSMTEIAEANPTYWGYIDYLWAKNGESFSEDAFAAYLADWLTEADATNVPYNSFGYVPVTPNEDFDGVWAVAWKSKALRDEAWKNWMANESTEKLTSNIHRNTLQANEGNAAWAETGGDIQAKFDAVAVCQPPGRFAGYSFRDDEEA